ncbi:uncharacterized protein LOC123670784 [Harmonia axyridis]|uniref:uncharacterized protein LOC123670784 n=1 Tax=Harmonia axyridis TaxID=115357 RepID=UPI001E2777DB|nr:uncharacterized protein LOC123670784 [Harmonia axyridis]
MAGRDLVFGNNEKYDIIQCFNQSNENVSEALELYFNRYPERHQPSRATIFRLKHNLLYYGAYSKPRPKVYNKENQEVDEINVLASVHANHQNSCAKLENETGVSRSRVHRILKQHKLKPYKFNIVQHLYPGDAARRMNFCNWFLNQAQRDIDFAKKIIWSDESHISSAGIFNRQNTRHWYDENHHIVFERQQQGRFGFNVACFILGTKIIYRIFEGSLTANDT